MVEIWIPLQNIPHNFDVLTIFAQKMAIQLCKVKNICYLCKKSKNKHNFIKRPKKSFISFFGRALKEHCELLYLTYKNNADMKFLSFLLFLWVVPFSLWAQQKWDFPIKPGTEKWILLGSHSKRVEACQIPEAVLVQMSTQELVEVCYNYPFLIEVFNYDCEKDGIRAIASQFNGLKILLERKDCVSSIMAFIEYLSKELQMNTVLLKPIKRGEIIAKERVIESILSTDEVLGKASNSEKDAIIKMAMKKFLLKNKRVEDFGRNSVTTSAFLLCTAMNKANITLNPVLKEFLGSKNPKLTKEVAENLIIAYSMFIK